MQQNQSNRIELADRKGSYLKQEEEQNQGSAARHAPNPFIPYQDANKAV